MPRSSSSSASSAARSAHFVVDGSNIATEGRSQPSLQQLNEAVLAFMEEHPGALITVVVDATFGHRIDKKEVKEFDDAVANNELVTPPAGAVGRGDAFVLSIANKAKAGILSNDSFQEFHGQYDWLFDQGRLIGGKPVPHVGWVFVERTPVRGPKSRQSVKEAKRAENGDAPASASSGSSRRRGRGAATSGSPLANAPLPVPTTPPPGPARAVPGDAAPADVAEQVAQAVAATASPPAGKGPVNELVPFLDFVERHPVGTSCTAVIESYSSHGAYARSDSVLVYIPLRLMDDPPPRSARSRLRLGEAVTLVVVGYAPERRSVDAALPHMAPAAPAAQTEAPAAKRSRRARATAPDTPDTAASPAATAVPDTAEPESPAPAKRSRSRRGAPSAAESNQPPAEVATPAADAVDAHADTADEEPRPTRRRRPARDTAAAEPAAEQPAAEQPAGVPAPAKRGATKQAATKKAVAKKAVAKKTAAKKAAATPAATESVPEPAATTKPAKGTPAKKSAAKKPATKKTAAKKSAAKKPAAKQSTADGAG